AYGLLPRLRDGGARTGDYTATPVAAVPGQLGGLSQPVQFLRGVGPRRAGELERFGLKSVEDVLYHLPFRYEDRRAMVALGALRPGVEATTRATVARMRSGVTARRGRRLLEVQVRDGDARLDLVWFHQLAYFTRRLRLGQDVLVHGRVEAAMGFGALRMVHPEVTVLEADDAEESGPPILPVYEKPTAMHGSVMRRLVQAAATDVAERVPSVLPGTVAARARVVDLARALRHVHLPAAEADIEALGEGRSMAHRSLVFDELFFLQLGLALRRSAVVAEAGTAFAPSRRLADALRGRLGFAPTGAQERAIVEIAPDPRAPHPMRRPPPGAAGSRQTPG